jgi:predicted acyl esterase
MQKGTGKSPVPLFLPCSARHPLTLAKHDQLRSPLRAQYWQRIADIDVSVESITIVAVSLGSFFDQEW